jgi:preprotein translocase subunit YajC
LHGAADRRASGARNVARRRGPARAAAEPEEQTVFISNAWAQGAAGSGQMDFLGLMPIILMFVVLYFLLIRPQLKRAKEHRNMIAALQKGDEVVLGGGELGRIVKIGDNYLTVEIAEGVQILLQKPAIQAVLPKGTIKAALD